MGEIEKLLKGKQNQELYEYLQDKPNIFDEEKENGFKVLRLALTHNKSMAIVIATELLKKNIEIPPLLFKELKKIFINPKFHLLLLINNAKVVETIKAYLKMIKIYLTLQDMQM